MEDIVNVEMRFRPTQARILMSRGIVSRAQAAENIAMENYV